MKTEIITIPLAIIIAGVIIGGAYYLSHAKAPVPSQTVNPITGTVSGTSMRPVTADDHILGNPNADIVIVEYSDTECPYCKMFQPTMQRVMDEYGKDGTVAWVYRHFPIASLHSKAPNEAQATECVNELGGPTAFWAYLNMIYAQTPSNDGLDPKELPKMASAVGVDAKAFAACLSSGKYKNKVQADYDDGTAAGVQGTPYILFITKDGTKTPISGAQSYNVMKQTIDTLLGK